MAVRRFPIRGDVDLASATNLQAQLDVLIAESDDDLVLDCEELAFIDSTGIGVFVQTHRVLEEQGRECRIENMSSRVRRPFDLLGLSERLGIGDLESTPRSSNAPIPVPQDLS